MERTWIKWILGLLILGVAGCSTLGSSGGKGTFKPQQLSEEEQRRISRYGELRNGILVDELRTAQPNEPTLRFHNERISYEGVLLLRYLGLRDVLGFEESEQFVRAVFEKIPTDNPDGVPLRNIVVPRWYQKGFPLVLQISTVFIKRENPAIPCHRTVDECQRSYDRSVWRQDGPPTESPVPVSSILHPGQYNRSGSGWGLPSCCAGKYAGV